MLQLNCQLNIQDAATKLLVKVLTFDTNNNWMRFFDIQNILTIKVEVGVTTRGRRLWISLLWISVKTKSNEKRHVFTFSLTASKTKCGNLT